MGPWGHPGWLGCCAWTLSWSDLAQWMPKAWIPMDVCTTGGCVHSRVAIASGGLLGATAAVQALPDLPAPRTNMHPQSDLVFRCICWNVCNVDVDPVCSRHIMLLHLANPVARRRCGCDTYLPQGIFRDVPCQTEWELHKKCFQECMASMAPSSMPLASIAQLAV